MTKLKQIWKCNVCGNIIEILHEGADSLVCCNQPMVLQEEKTEEEGNEKHKPIIDTINEKKERIKIKIGEIPHPMEDKHFIEWIEANTEDRVLRKFLKPGEKPEKEFTVRGLKFTARAYCNVHGLWKS